MRTEDRVRSRGETVARPRPSDRWIARLITVLGAGGFIGLLVLAPHMGSLQDYARGLGALLALAPRALYAPHLATAQAWGLSPLEDQQLAGLIMWIPAGTIYLAAAIAAARRGLMQSRPALTPSPAR